MTTYSYDRSKITAGIVHFGVGNFHRAHLEYYTNRLLEDADQQCWGVFGAMIMPQDGRLYNALKADGGHYELTTCAPDGVTETIRIGSLVGLAWGVEDREAIISKIADESTRIITLTITEGGYVVNYDNPDSVFSYVAEALQRRMTKGLPITILSCDNLQHNGCTAERSFMSYFKYRDESLWEWAKTNVSFPNSMVDRITPVTKSGKITDVRCEDFLQWVIEDRFLAGRPAWERVGVQFTSDVAPYENMKLSLLNGSHSLLSYGAYLEGYRKVDDVLADTRYHALLRDFMDKDVTPYVPAPEGIDLDDYKATLLRRFGNPAISDQVSRLCQDGMARFAVYIVPTLEKMLRDGADTVRLSLHFANYFKYVSLAVTESGEAIDVDEPHITEADAAILAKKDPVAFLEASPFSKLKLASRAKFLEDYLWFVNHSVAEGLARVLD